MQEKNVDIELARAEAREVALGNMLDEGRVLEDVDGLASDEVDVLLVVLHAGDVVGQSGALLTAVVGGVVAEQVGDLGAVGRVLVDAQLDVAAELKNRYLFDKKRVKFTCS